MLDFLDALNSASRQSIIKSPHVKELQTSNFKQSPKLICLNSVDNATLESLPVFSPVLSARTLRYREALGGVVKLSQLQEV